MKTPTKRNPLVPRLAWVAKQYKNDFVTATTLAAWAEATGHHALAEDAYREIYNDIHGDDEYRSVAGPHMLSPSVIEARLAQAALGLETTTRFDRYLPWAAREFSRMLKRDYFKQDLLRGGWPHGVSPGVNLWGDSGDTRRFSGHVRDLITSFRTIVDWAIATNTNLDGFSAANAENAASLWAHEQRQTGPATQGEVVYAFDDGWTVQRLEQSQLESEGATMGHCVGEGGYDEAVESGQTLIFSLRDPKGHPHATMEVDGRTKKINQLRGKQNRAPNEDYTLRMAAFARDYLGRCVSFSKSEIIDAVESWEKRERKAIKGFAADGKKALKAAKKGDWQSAASLLDRAARVGIDVGDESWWNAKVYAEQGSSRIGSSLQWEHTGPRVEKFEALLDYTEDFGKHGSGPRALLAHLRGGGSPDSIEELLGSTVYHGFEMEEWNEFVHSMHDFDELALALWEHGLSCDDADEAYPHRRAANPRQRVVSPSQRKRRLMR